MSFFSNTFWQRKRIMQEGLYRFFVVCLVVFWGFFLFVFYFSFLGGGWGLGEGREGGGELCLQMKSLFPCTAGSGDSQNEWLHLILKVHKMLKVHKLYRHLSSEGFIFFLFCSACFHSFCEGISRLCSTHVYMYIFEEKSLFWLVNLMLLTTHSEPNPLWFCQARFVWSVLRWPGHDSVLSWLQKSSVFLQGLKPVL